MKRPELQKMGCDDVILKDPQKWGGGGWGGSGAAEIVYVQDGSNRPWP